MFIDNIFFVKCELSEIRKEELGKRDFAVLLWLAETELRGK